MPGQARFELAPMGKPARMLTIAYFFLAGVLGVLMPYGSWVSAFLLLLALGVWCLFRPSFFEIEGEFLTVHWPLKSRRIPFFEIEDVQMTSAAELGWIMRVGVGGLWGSFGLFKTNALGWVNGYFSDLEALVVLRLKHGYPLLISPEERTAFVAALEGWLKMRKSSEESIPSM